MNTLHRCALISVIVALGLICLPLTHAQVINSGDRIEGFVIIGVDDYFSPNGIADPGDYYGPEGMVAVGAEYLPALYELSLILSPFLYQTPSSFNVARIKVPTSSTNGPMAGVTARVRTVATSKIPVNTGRISLRNSAPASRNA